jgi:hypothetical protein
MAYRRLPRQEHEEETTASPEGTRIFVIAVLTAVILGFLCGLVWVGWNLLLHVLR